MRKSILASAIAVVMTIAFAAQAAAPPAKPQDRFAQNGAVKIHYVVEGKGPLVVMIHGFPDYWATWKPLMATLSAAGYRTAALDNRGYNLSDKPKGEAAYAMPNLVGDVAAVIAAEGQKDAIVIGHDWGAAIAWNVEFMHPELVNKLIILSVPHPAGLARELATNKAQQEGSNYARNFQKEGSEKMLTAEGLAGWVKDPDARKKYVEAFGRSDFGAMLNYYKRNYPREPYTEDTSPLKKVQAPVLMIHGLKDTALLAPALNGNWDYVERDLTLTTVPTAGHFVQADEPDFVTKTMRAWLLR